MDQAKLEKVLLKVPKEAIYATGRRKESVAKVWMFPGKGQIYINGQELLAYVKRPVLQAMVLQPLKIAGFDGKYDIRVSVLGGGLTGQAGAAQLGIARIIVKINSELIKDLKQHKLLTRDSRTKERKKYGLRGARKKPTYRKR